MKYNYYFDIAAIMLNLMLLLIIYIRRTYPTKTCFLYKLMLWLNLISSSCDLMSAFMISSPQNYSLFFNYTVNAAYLLSHNLTSVVFFLYVIRLIRNNDGKKSERILWKSVSVYITAAILTSPFTKLIFYFDENMQYCHGPLMITLYITSIGILAYTLVLFIRHKKALSDYQMATNIAFLMLLVGAVIFQAFYPSVLIESFCAAIAFLMMNVALDNPETYFYRNTYCFNQAAFSERVNDRISRGIGFRILAFAYDDIKLFRKKYGESSYDAMIYDTIEICQKLFKQNKFCLLNSDSIVINIDDCPDVNALIENLNSHLVRTITTASGETASLTVHYCILDYPSVYETSDDIIEAINSMLFDEYRNTGERLITNCTDMLDSRRREAQVVHQLRMAIDNDGFDVFYQPIFERETGKFISAEALVRLKQTDGDFIGPDEFIPVAENNGMVSHIGEMVFEKVCRFLSETDLSQLDLQYVEVNLSKIQLMNSADVDKLVEIAGRYNISPGMINFEITETVDLDSNERDEVNCSIARLRSLGFEFSLDDYGSGYSNVSYIADMPFNIVKIDKNILWKAMNNQNHRIILHNCISLVKCFGMKCVAEGVENDEMADLLTICGCDLFQGYLYSRPVTEDAFVKYLKEHKSEA